VVTSHNYFREYIQFRSWMVVFAAVFLAVVGMIVLAFLITSSPANIHRFGLLLQFLGGLSIVPHVIGRQHLGWLRNAAAARVERGDPPDQPVDGAASQPAEEGANPNPAQATTSDDMEASFAYYQAHNLHIVLGNTFFSLSLMALFAALLFIPQLRALIPDQIFPAVLAFIGFFWLNLFMLIQIFLFLRVPAPAGLLSWFFSLDFVLSMLGLGFAGVVYILSNWLAKSVGYVFQNGLRRVLMVITLPTVLTGLLLEILAAFLG